MFDYMRLWLNCVADLTGERERAPVFSTERLKASHRSGAESMGAASPVVGDPLLTVALRLDEQTCL